MPRKEAITTNFSSVADATNQDILDALGDKSLSDVVDSLEEVNHMLRSTHLGHELHIWGEEVEA